MEGSKPFVVQDDIIELSRNGIDFEKDIKIFLSEIRLYFNEVGSEEYYIEEEIESLEEFNKKILCNYPSYGGHCILDSSFTGWDIPLHLLSNKSIEILGYFYGIYLNYYNDDSVIKDEGKA